jgi:DNA-binding NarL/FixJ family response regulator
MKILLVDDHPLILSALQSVIQSLRPGVKVVTAGGARAARAQLQSQDDFDLVMLDLQLGDADGFEVLTEFRKTYASLPVVVISASDRQSDVIRAVDAGAMGFVPKRFTNEALYDALHVVMSGGIYIPIMEMGQAAPPPGTVGVAAQAMLGIVRNQANAGQVQSQPPLASLGLTPRQSEVLTLLLQGKPNKLIARDLNVSVETVKDHVAAVLRALGVNSRTQAVLAVGQMSQQGSFNARRTAEP